MRGTPTLLFALSLLTAPVAPARAAYDAFTPACEIPLFHWTLRKVDAKSVEKHMLDRTRGAREATRDKWDPYQGGGDLAGKGLYLEADPFSSQSYGNTLVIAYVKPRQAMKDLRPLGDLDDPEVAKSVGNEIRGDGILFAHRWISQYGTNDGVAVRLPKTARAADLPFVVSHTAFVRVRGDGPRRWAKHQEATPADSLASALQKYSDRLPELFASWNASAELPGDDLTWDILKSDIAEIAPEDVGEFSQDKGGSHWSPFDSCEEMSAEDLARANAALARAGLIDTAGAKSSCELKQAMLKVFRRGEGYKNYLSIYRHLQGYKNSLGLERSPGGSVGISTLSATCGGR